MGNYTFTKEEVYLACKNEQIFKNLTSKTKIKLRQQQRTNKKKYKQFIVYRFYL